MKKLIVKPGGWPCPLKECPPGLFTFERTLCVRTDYPTRLEDGSYTDPVYLVDGGSVFWGGTKTCEDRGNLLVQPSANEWVEEETR